MVEFENRPLEEQQAAESVVLAKEQPKVRELLTAAFVTLMIVAAAGFLILFYVLV